MSAAPPVAAKTKVLVADDSEAERSFARSALVRAGFEVVEAHDGQHALEVFARERPDVVLLDVVMPRLTGLETCRILKAKTHSGYLPVIMLSTRNSVNARVEGLRSGADDYLGKPYDPEELRARVEALLRTKKVLGERASGRRLIDDSAEGAEDPSEQSERNAAAAFRRRMEEEFDRAERYSDPLACLRIEIDGYESIREGAEAERRARAVAELREVIESTLRKIDLVHRIDERGFMLVLPNTHFPGALAVAERIARDIRRRRAAANAAPITISVGVSFFPNKGTQSLQDLLDLVDAALARARNEGPGRICLYQHQGYLYVPED